MKSRIYCCKIIIDFFFQIIRSNLSNTHFSLIVKTKLNSSSYTEYLWIFKKQSFTFLGRMLCYLILQHLVAFTKTVWVTGAGNQRGLTQSLMLPLCMQNSGACNLGLDPQKSYKRCHEKVVDCSMMWMLFSCHALSLLQLSQFHIQKKNNNNNTNPSNNLSIWLAS